ncbi:glutaminase [Paracoccus albus]|uniref:glutaminase n=1 Tax=Paracoccus albus TaxID=3017784 RepID=UPI0022F0B451|nr:glutaminase [Paracoccus albus]WBU60914.1 glutaminase [Paracoccus albus]
MKSPITDYLKDVLEDTRQGDAGEVAAYIPELAQADPDRVAIAVATVDGVVYSAGDEDYRFTIQSMSKPFAYALAIRDNGLDHVLARIGVEPSGEAFNEISLESDTGRPKNPMINAGAIATHALVGGSVSQRDRNAEIMTMFSAFAGRDLEVDEAVFSSELDHGHRNLGLGHLMKSFGVIEDNPVDAVEGYIRQCALKVDVRDLAIMAATLANYGQHPVSGDRLLQPSTVRQVLSVMTSCGMYDAAGDWLTTVGIPAKSGVAGGIIGVLPGQVGIAVFSPRLDEHGNSVRGVKMMERLSRDLGMHIMDVFRPSRSALRNVSSRELPNGEQATVYEMQGDMIFATMESVLRHLDNNPLPDHLVVFDVTRVDEFHDVAKRMAAEAGARLMDEDGHRVVLIDPDKVIAGFETSHGAELESYAKIDQIPQTDKAVRN